MTHLPINSIAKPLAVAVSIACLSFGALAAPCFTHMPLKEAMIVNSWVGMRMSPTQPIKWRAHNGTDYRARLQNLYAVEAGKVIRTEPGKSTGQQVVLQGNDGTIYKYFHLSETIVHDGQIIPAGFLIGVSGDTTNAKHTVPYHLHFEVWIKGQPVETSQFLCNNYSVSNPKPSTPGVPIPGHPLPPAWPHKDVPIPTDIKGVPLPGVVLPTVPPPSPVTSDGIVTAPMMPPENSFPNMSGTSKRDFLFSEAHKRFSSPQWQYELLRPNVTEARNTANTSDPAPIGAFMKPHLLRELNTMYALKNLMATEKYAQQLNIETRMAALLSLDAQNYSDKVKAMTKSTLSTR